MVINSEDLLKAEPIKEMVSRKIIDQGVSYGLTEAGLDIRIKQEIYFFEDARNKRAIVRTDWPDGMASVESAHEGRFVLASAIEEFQMPSNLMGIVHDKSTWARQGLSVFNTCIEPGWNGFLTLELVYHGSEDLLIPAGSGIAQVIFHELSLEREYKGKYQNQEDKPVSAKFE